MKKRAKNSEKFKKNKGEKNSEKYQNVEKNSEKLWKSI